MTLEDSGEEAASLEDAGAEAAGAEDDAMADSGAEAGALEAGVPEAGAEQAASVRARTAVRRMQDVFIKITSVEKYNTVTNRAAEKTRSRAVCYTQFRENDRSRKKTRGSHCGLFLLCFKSRKVLISSFTDSSMQMPSKRAHAASRAAMAFCAIPWNRKGHSSRARAAPL